MLRDTKQPPYIIILIRRLEASVANWAYMIYNVHLTFRRPTV